jgi:hypothetical protein
MPSFTGNRPAGLSSTRPSSSTIRNPVPWNRPPGSVAPAWQPPPATPTPSAYDRYIEGRKPATPAPRSTTPRTTSGGFNTGQLSGGGMPTRSGSSPALGRSNFNPADYGLRPTPASAVPGGAPSPTATRSPLIPSGAPSPGRLPGLRIPPGLGRLGQGLGGLGAGLSAIGEGGRLGQLIAEPENYWQGQDRQFRDRLPFLFPDADARPGLGNIPRAAIPVVPFNGGQSPGVLYRVTANYSYGAGNPPAPINDSIVVLVTGPIGGVSTTTENGQKTWNLITGLGPVFLLSASETDPFSSAGIGNIQREDGQPDEGGDPPPVLDPDAPQRPALAPPTAPFIPPPTAALPNAVPFNNPRLIPTPGVLPPPSNAPLPNPFAPPATEPIPLPGPRLLPSPRPGGAPTEPAPSQSPATPNNQGRQDPAGRGQLPGLIPAAIMAGTLLIGERLANRPAPSPAATTPPTTGAGGPPTPFCRFHEDSVSHSKLDRQFGQLQTMEAFQAFFQAGMDAKLGPQIPNGGISGKLGRLGQMASKTWNFLQVDRVLNILSWIGILHNAYMLSNNLAQTLFSAIGNVLDAVGIQKVDEDGNESPYDIQEVVNGWVDAFGKRAFGVEEWQGMKAQWKAYNRIYQAAANIVNSLRSITFAMVEMLENIANYTGRIGNALRKSGTVLSSAFGWMNPNANFSSNRFFNALNNTQEAVEAVDQIASSVLSIQETSAQLANQKNEFEKAVSDAEKLIEQQETAASSGSKRPSLNISTSDEKKAE